MKNAAILLLLMFCCGAVFSVKAQDNTNTKAKDEKKKDDKTQQYCYLAERTGFQCYFRRRTCRSYRRPDTDGCTTLTGNTTQPSGFPRTDDKDFPESVKFGGYR